MKRTTNNTERDKQQMHAFAHALYGLHAAVGKYLLTLGMFIALAAAPAELSAQKATDKVPADKLAQMLYVQKIYHDPFPNNQWVKRLVSCDGKLFFAAGNWSSDSTPTLKILRLDHPGCKLWVDVTPAWKSPPGGSTLAMAAFKGQLYVGTNQGEICRIDPQGTSQSITQLKQALSSMAVFKGQLYAVGDTTLYRTSDGIQWENLGPAFSLPDASIDGATTLEALDGYLYLGFGFKRTLAGKSLPEEEGIQLWRTADGKNAQLFKKVSSDLTQLFPDDAPQHVHAMKAFAGQLYIGGYEGGSGYVMRTDGTPGNWELISFAKNGSTVALEIHDKQLFAGLFEYRPGMADAQILAATSDGKLWSPVPGAPVGTKTSQGIASLASHGGRLYFGTGDLQLGGEVFELGQTLSLCQIADIGKYSSKSVVDLLQQLKTNLKDAKLAKAGKSANMIDQLTDSLRLAKLADSQEPLRAKALGHLQTVRQELRTVDALVDRSVKAGEPDQRANLLKQGGEHADRAHDIFAQFLATLTEVSGGAASPPQPPVGKLPLTGGKGPGIHGRVFALDETGDLRGVIPAANIEFKNAAGQAVAKTTTNEHGYYTLELPAGTYQYKVQAAGFKDEDFGRGRQLVLTNGYAIYNFSLVKGKTDSKQTPPKTIPVEIGNLKGQVFEKTDDGTLTGIPGATITLVNPKSIGRPTQVVSQFGDDGDNGKYAVTLEAATYHASVVANGFAKLVDPQPILVEKGKTTTRDFILSRLKRPPIPLTQGIKGTITFAKSRQEPEKKPAIRVWIIPLQGQQGRTNFTPDVGGKYAEKLATGLYQVVAEADGYRPASSGPRQVYAGRFSVVDLTLRPLPITTPETKDITVLAKVFQKQSDGNRGAPLAGATVLFRLEGKRPSDKGRGNTDARGEISLILPAGSYDAVAYKTGFKPQALKANVQSDSPQRYVFLLEPELPPTVLAQAKITFKVMQTDAEFGMSALPGADVEVMHQNRVVAGGKTNGSGSFATETLPPAAYDVLVSREGFVPARFQVVLADTDIHRDVVLTFRSTTPSTESRLQLWIVETPAELGKGIGRAQIRISQKGKLATSVETDADGRSEMSLKFGDYVLQVSRAGYQSRTIDLSVNQAEVRQTIALDPDRTPPPQVVAKLQVKLVEASPNAPPISAAQVFVLQGNQTVANRETADDGTATFSLRPGDYVIAARKDQYQPVEIPFTQDSRDQLLTIRLMPLATPLPRVALLHLRAINDKGRPLGGAKAVVQQADTPVDSAYSSRDGLTTFRLKPGPYTITLSKAGYKSATMQVTMGYRDIYQDLALAATSVVPPVLADANLQLAIVERESRTGRMLPVPSASVAVLLQGQTITTGTTDPLGRFQVRLQRRDYEVVVSKAGFQTSRVPTDLRAGDTSRTILLTRLIQTLPSVEKNAWLQIQVTAYPPRITRLMPLPEADVQVNWGSQSVGRGRTDSAGRFNLELRRDRYEVVISKAGYETARLAVDLRQGNVQRSVTLNAQSTFNPKLIPLEPLPAQKVSLTLRITEIARGKVTVVPGAAVTLQQGGMNVVQGSSDLRGTFFAGNLKAGNYRIIVTKSGHQAVQIDTAITADLVRTISLQRSPVIK